MKIVVKKKSSTLIIEFITEEDDKIFPSKKYHMNQNKCKIKLPKDLILEDIHPDHLALAVIMLCSPFVGKRLVLPFEVSYRFYQATKTISKYEVGPYNYDVEPWEPMTDSRGALAFSGGVDSSAALLLMPKDTGIVFLDRIIKKKTLYDKDAPKKICDKLLKMGYDVHIVESDLEYLREPVGFPVDVANSVPAVLLADLLSFNSIAFGTIMESAYRIGHSKYLNYPEGSHYKLWGTLFKAAGLPLNLPVAGISEVGTSMLVIGNEIGELSQSCIRGKWKYPCRNCWKCFRKILLEKTLKKEYLDDSLLDEMFKIPEAKIHLSAFPIKHENVLTYIASKYEGKHKIMNLLKKRVAGDIKDLNWLEKWNSESIDLVPKMYRNEIYENILLRLEEMTSEDLQKFKNWNMEEILEQEEYNNYKLNLVKALENPN